MNDPPVNSNAGTAGGTDGIVPGMAAMLAILYRDRASRKVFLMTKRNSAGLSARIL